MNTGLFGEEDNEDFDFGEDLTENVTMPAANEIARGTILYYHSAGGKRASPHYVLGKLRKDNRKDFRYGVVGNSKQLEIVDVRDRRVWGVKKRGGYEGPPFVGLTREEKARLDDGPKRAQAQVEGRSAFFEMLKTFGRTNKATKKNSWTVKTALEYTTNSAGLIWPYRMLGFIGASAFMAWRAWEYLEVGEKIERTAEWGEAVSSEVHERAVAVTDKISDLGETDPKELFISAMWFFVFLLVIRYIVMPVLASFGLIPKSWCGMSGDEQEGSLPDWMQEEGDIDFGASASDTGESLAGSESETSKIEKGFSELGGKLDKLTDVLLQQAKGDGASSSGGTAGSSQVPAPLAVDNLLRRVEHHIQVVEDDDGRGRKSKKPRSERSSRKKKKHRKEDSTSSSGDESSSDSGGGRRRGEGKKHRKKKKRHSDSGTDPDGKSADSDSENERLKGEIADLEREALDPRAMVLKRLRKFRKKVRWSATGPVKSRVAPHLLAKLYKGGFET